jgi:hypothetical protein
MSQGAFTGETGAALESEAEQPGMGTVGWGVAGRRGSIEANQWDINGCGHMHESGIVGYGKVGGGEQVNHIGERGLSTEISGPGRESGNRSTEGLVSGRAHNPYGFSFF